MLSYSAPIVTTFEDPSFSERPLKVTILHENENHPYVSGNKWWKLKYNLEQAKEMAFDTVLTFGGAYSNHIYATAAAAKEYGLKSIGVIRGEEATNTTLRFAKSCGMELIFVDRERYREMTRMKHSWVRLLKDGSFDFAEERMEPIDSIALRMRENTQHSFFVIPEGGTNELAMRGVSEWANKILEIDFDDVYIPVGTGGTIAGLIKGFKGQRNIIGVSVLKNDGFLEKDIQSLLKEERYNNWTLLNQYHFGGYAKSNKELISFCEQMKRNNAITIEPVYSGKLFYAVFDQLKTSPELQNRKSLIIHTGGLQYLR